MDEIGGSSLEASVAGLGWKAGTLTDLSNLEVLYIKHVQNIKITFVMGPLTCMLLSFTSQNQGALEKIPHFCRTIIKASS